MAEQELSLNARLTNAVGAADIELAHGLLERGADANHRWRAYFGVWDDVSVLSLACSYRRPAMIELLVAAGADPNFRTRRHSLVYEVAGSFECVAALGRGVDFGAPAYDRGADPGIPDPRAECTCECACECACEHRGDCGHPSDSDECGCFEDCACYDGCECLDGCMCGYDAPRDPPTNAELFIRHHGERARRYLRGAGALTKPAAGGRRFS